MNEKGLLSAIVPRNLVHPLVNLIGALSVVEKGGWSGDIAEAP